MSVDMRVFSIFFYIISYKKHKIYLEKEFFKNSYCKYSEKAARPWLWGQERELEVGAWVWQGNRGCQRDGEHTRAWLRAGSSRDD